MLPRHSGRSSAPWSARPSARRCGAAVGAVVGTMVGSPVGTPVRRSRRRGRRHRGWHGVPRMYVKIQVFDVFSNGRWLCGLADLPTRLMPSRRATAFRSRPYGGTLEVGRTSMVGTCPAAITPPIVGDLKAGVAQPPGVQSSQTKHAGCSGERALCSPFFRFSPNVVIPRVLVWLYPCLTLTLDVI